MKAWTVFFLLWVASGGASTYVVGRGISKHNMFLRRYLPWTVMAWLSFSAVAAEITRQYLTIYPFPLSLCLAAAIALLLLGVCSGWLAGWFIGGDGLGIAADAVAGMLGSFLTGWIEITLSYNHPSYIIPLSILGAAFGTMVLRLWARAQLSFQESRN